MRRSAGLCCGRDGESEHSVQFYTLKQTMAAASYRRHTVPHASAKPDSTNTSATHKFGAWSVFSENWPVDGGKDLAKALKGDVVAPVRMK